MTQDETFDPLSRYLQAWAEEHGWSYLSYRHEPDFASLWFGSSPVRPHRDGDALSPILLDWNGVPFPGEARIAEFTTPLDWALGAAYRSVESGGGEPTLPQIVIVDRHSQHCPGSFAVEMSQGLVDALGGRVRLFSAFGANDSDPIAVLELLRSATLAPREASESRLPLRPLRQGQLRALRQAWIGYTVQSRDHHDINNLIGPLALAANPRSEVARSTPEELAERALYRMVEFLDLVESDSKPLKPGWLVKDRFEKLTKAGPIAAILVDDQAQRWVGFLQNAFGSHVSVVAESDPAQFLENVVTASSLRSFERLVALRTPVLDPAPADQILFMDLRFFQLGNSSERQFLANLCARILETDFKPKWNGDQHFGAGPLSPADHALLSSQEWAPARPLKGLTAKVRFPFIEAAQRILMSPDIPWNVVAESTLYDSLLTLFPRFVAQILFTTPIILFSSTGRRDLTDYFKGYDNIITAFEKPRLPVQRGQVVRSLRAALDAATPLLTARRVLRLMAAAAKAPDFSVMGTGDGHCHVELYIDEHCPTFELPNGRRIQDDRYIVVGGFYAIYVGQSREEALKLAASFDDALTTQGFSYYSRDPFGPAPAQPTPIKSKGASAIAELRDALEQVRPTFFGCLRLTSDERQDRWATAYSGDDVYRRTLGSLVEVFVYELLPAYIEVVNREKVSISIYAGTRSSYRALHHADEARSQAFRWGLHVDPAQDQWRGANQPIDRAVFLESLSRTSLYAVLCDLRAARGESFPVERALGVRMIYDNAGGKPSVDARGYAICRRCGLQLFVRMKADHANKRVEFHGAQSCPACNSTDDVRPDYPGGLYIADEILDKDWLHRSGYPEIVNMGSLGFDEILDGALQKLTAAGRAADSGDKVAAALHAAAACQAGTVDDASGRLSPLRAVLLGRVMRGIDDLHGGEFSSLSLMLRAHGGGN